LGEIFGSAVGDSGTRCGESADCSGDSRTAIRLHHNRSNADFPEDALGKARKKIQPHCPHFGSSNVVNMVD
jgi:hypothetical protein